MISRRQILSQTVSDEQTDQYDLYSSGYGKVDEEDVWYTQDRLFEDHLFEIYNKWSFLDDDIWCKLIIMERNRRIGKAYARTPVISIDGSHELSFDGFRLGLNGFENPDRDLKTEECKTRLGKGIRIRMDESGNIIVMRFSKCNAYVKSWHHQLHHHHHTNSAGNMMINSSSSSGSTNSSTGGGNKSHHANGKKLASNEAPNGPINPLSPSSLSSTLSSGDSNDSAIADDIIKLNGKIEYNKTYLLFDMKKFQANIAQELCRPYPDKKKLEQQCFSIIGLVADANDILNLPCWIMVINIVAIEMLESRFNPGNIDQMVSSNGHHAPLPNFISIFDHKQGPSHQKSSKSKAQKEEDPYSIPANASTDSKSSTNNYGTTSTRNMSTITSQQASRAYQYHGRSQSSSHHHQTSYQQSNGQSNGILGNRSGSNNNIYGSASIVASMMQRHHHQYGDSGRGGNNVVPPKLPPRAHAMKSHSKSTNNVSAVATNYQSAPGGAALSNGANKRYNGLNNGNNNTATNNDTNNNNSNNINSKDDCDASQQQQRSRKTKRNRFLDSLHQLPAMSSHDLANSKSSPSLAATTTTTTAAAAAAGTGSYPDQLVGGSSGGRQKAPVDSGVGKKIASKKSSKSKKISDGLKSLKSSSTKVKGNTANPTTATTTTSTTSATTTTTTNNNNNNNTSSNQINNYDEDSYANVEDEGDNSIRCENDQDDVDSVVDGLDDDDEAALGRVGNFNVLDIPTPDYETDENIYSVDSNFQMPKTCMQQIYNKQKSLAKEDLYYSGLQARVPQNITSRHYSRRSQYSPAAADKMNSTNSATKDHRLAMSYNGTTPRGGQTSSNDGKNINNDQQQQQKNPSSTARYRSASMQRYYPSGATTNGKSSAANYVFDMPYSHYQMDGSNQSRDYGHRRSSNYAINNMNGGVGVGVGAHGKQLTMSNVNYEIGRSSSGIYGNHSTSSSSDYADWHPHMRKHNSSGYLNSLFRNHVTSPVFYNTKPLTPSAHNSHRNQQQQQQQHHLSTISKQKQQQQYGNGNSAQTLSKQQQVAMMHQSQSQKQQHLHQSQQQHHHTNHHQQANQMATSKRTIATNDGNYRTYDSSNDSEPSYTNSSDGLDIYDQIGGHAITMDHHRAHQASFTGPPVPSIGAVNHHHHHSHSHQQQRELYVGEWENL